MGIDESLNVTVKIELVATVATAISQAKNKKDTVLLYLVAQELRKKIKCIVIDFDEFQQAPALAA